MVNTGMKKQLKLNRRVSALHTLKKKESKPTWTEDRKVEFERGQPPIERKRKTNAAGESVADKWKERKRMAGGLTIGSALTLNRLMTTKDFYKNVKTYGIPDYLSILDCLWLKLEPTKNYPHINAVIVTYI